MTRCVACDTMINSTASGKKRLDPEDMNENFKEEEDLCNTCLGIAREAYLFYNEDDPAVRDEDTRRHFYTNANSFDDSYNVVKEVTDNGSIGIEES